MSNPKSPSRAIRPMSLHFGAASSPDNAAYFDRKGAKFKILYL